MKRSTFFLLCMLSSAVVLSQFPCEEGVANGYPCSGLDLMSHLSLDALGGGENGNDCWGWVDPNSGREFVLFGRHNGLSIVEVTDPVNPVYLANVPTASSGSLWRDVKVHQNHAFVVSEASSHGMQVVDLSAVTEIGEGPVDLTPVATYLGFGNAHNIVLNEASGFAYGVGTNTAGGGLHAVDVSNPSSPAVAGTYDGAYTHDAQVVNYAGPDADHEGKEVAFCFNGSSGIAIVDVTTKSDMQLISQFGYPNSAYTHQGWLNEDQTIVYFNDELDELGAMDSLGYGHGTRTYIADVSDLDNPVVLGYYEADNTAIDHNLYVRGNKVYASNYMSGLRVSTILPSGQLEPYAHFDVRPDSDTTRFYGTWSNYPYFPSGNIAISCRSVGLFMVSDPNYDPSSAVEWPSAPTERLSVHPNPAQEGVVLDGMASANRMRILNVVGEEVWSWRAVAGLSGLHVDVSTLGEGVYFVQAANRSGELRTTRLVLAR